MLNMDKWCKCIGGATLLVVVVMNGGCFSQSDEKAPTVVTESSSAENSSSKSEQNKPSITENERATAVGKLQYPVVNTGSKQVSDAINSNLEALVEDLVSKEDKYTKKDLLTYEVKLDNEDVIAILFEHVATYEGAARPLVTMITRVYDKHTGAVKPLSAYVDINIAEVLDMAASVGIYSVNGDGPRELKINPTVDKLPQTYFPDGEGNLWLVFQRYDLTAGVEGPSAVKIPASRLKK